MKPDELLRMWLKDHAENRFGQAIACEQSYRTGKFASVADRMAAVHRAAGDVYAAALRALDKADQPAATETGPQGAPLTPTRSMAVGEMAEMLTTGRAPQGAPPCTCNATAAHDSDCPRFLLSSAARG